MPLAKHRLFQDYTFKDAQEKNRCTNQSLFLPRHEWSTPTKFGFGQENVDLHEVSAIEIRAYLFSAGHAL